MYLRQRWTNKTRLKLIENLPSYHCAIIITLHFFHLPKIVPRMNATHTDLIIWFLWTIKVPCFICMMIKCETSVCQGLLNLLSLLMFWKHANLHAWKKKTLPRALLIHYEHFRLYEALKKVLKNLSSPMIPCLLWLLVTEFCVSLQLEKHWFVLQNVQFCSKKVWYCDLNGEKNMFILSNFTLALCEKMDFGTDLHSSETH